VTIASGADSVGQAAATAGAEDAAAQVVLSLAGPLPGDSFLVQQPLDLLKGLLVDEGWVATLERLGVRLATLVDDPPGVVGVAQ
jgi:hypothetical protein